MTMAKKTSSNAVKKIDKQLDKLLKEKKELEDIPVIDKKEIDKKIREDKRKNSTRGRASSTTRNSSKKDTLVAKERGKTTKKKDALVVKERKGTSKKKEALVVDERKNNMRKKRSSVSSVSKRKGVTSKRTINKKEEPKIGESTMKLQKLEIEIRSLYDKVNDVVEDIDLVKTVDESDNILIADVVVKDKELSTDDSIGFLGKVTLVLAAIFTILFIAFIIFVIYVCTY